MPREVSLLILSWRVMLEAVILGATAEDLSNIPDSRLKTCCKGAL
jgi:hypothetical protein